MGTVLYIPPREPTLTDAMQTIQFEQRSIIARVSNEAWWRGFWWGALAFAVLGVWGGWLAAHFAGVAQ